MKGNIANDNRTSKEAENHWYEEEETTLVHKKLVTKLQQAEELRYENKIYI